MQVCSCADDVNPETQGGITAYYDVGGIPANTDLVREVTRASFEKHDFALVELGIRIHERPRAVERRCDANGG